MVDAIMRSVVEAEFMDETFDRNSRISLEFCLNIYWDVYIIEVEIVNELGFRVLFPLSGLLRKGTEGEGPKRV